LRQLHGDEKPPRLRVIGDISCDIEGAIEATVKSTEPGDPVFVYDPFEDQAIDGVEGRGPVILAVDILPSELPRDASKYFSGVLMDHVPAIAQADYTVPFEEVALPPAIKRAVIVYQGKLTPNYRYLERYLNP
jgi:saccharopine dehydrogenase (NAD+, L-lysine-forming)